MRLWSGDQVEPLARIARFVESQGAVPGIQLAHAGRKASCDVPWRGGRRLKTAGESGWPVVEIEANKDSLGEIVNGWVVTKGLGTYGLR